MSLTNATPASNSEAVYREFKGALMGFISGRVGNPADVEDLFQEAMVKIHRRIGDLKSSEKLGSWIYQITRNVIVDYYRKRGSRPDHVPFDEETEVSDEQEGSFVEELSSCIVPMLNSLEPKYRDILKSIDLDRVKQSVYAKEKGLPLPTVKSRVQRARKQLRSLFDVCCRFEFDKRGMPSDYVNKDCSRCD